PSRLRRSEEHTSELQSHLNVVCRLLLEKKKLVQLLAAGHHRDDLLPRHVRLGKGAVGRATVEQGEAFFFNDTATTEIYTLSLHDALPISESPPHLSARRSLFLSLGLRRSTAAA